MKIKELSIIILLLNLLSCNEQSKIIELDHFIVDLNKIKIHYENTIKFSEYNGLLSIERHEEKSIIYYSANNNRYLIDTLNNFSPVFEVGNNIFAIQSNSNVDINWLILYNDKGEKNYISQINGDLKCSSNNFIFLTGLFSNNYLNQNEAVIPSYIKISNDHLYAFSSDLSKCFSLGIKIKDDQDSMIVKVLDKKDYVIIIFGFESSEYKYGIKYYVNLDIIEEIDLTTAST